MTTIIANVPLLSGVYSISIEGKKIKSVRMSNAKTNLCLGPALFDVQVNGYAGRTCRIPSPDKKDALAYITRVLREQGVGLWMPTITTAPSEVMLKAFQYCAEALEEDRDTAASIPGFHMEGPYISPVDGPRGAHQLPFVRKPDWEEFQRFQEAAGGRIRYVTLAPEEDGGIEFIRKCVKAGIVAALGHTNPTRDDVRRAVDAGATMCTHLGNAAHHMIQRHTNYFWHQLADRSLFASFIADSHHLPEDCLYCFVHAKGLDLSLITSDAIELGGMKPGVYGMRGRQVEKLPSGRINLVGTPNLAGGSFNQRECVQTVIRLVKLSHADGWKLGSVQPARMMGLDRRLGIAEGKEATLTVYNYRKEGPEIDVLQTWVAGKKVFDSAIHARVAIPDEPIDRDDD